MSLFSTSSSSSRTGGSAPVAPTEAQGGISDYIRLINSYGQQNPYQYVAPASRTQNAAFSMGARMANRYGANTGGETPSHTQPMGFGVPVGVGGGAFQAGPASPSLYAQGGVQPEGQRDYEAYVSNDPGLLNAYNNLTGEQRAHIARSHGDGSGNIDLETFGQFHWDTHGAGENRNMPTSGGVPSSGGPPSTASWAQPGYGYSMADDVGLNPVAGFRDAANMTRGVGSGGANLADVFTMDERIDMGPASAGAARRGIEFSKDYENQYTDNVVDTTLANFDEHAGRQRAAEAAQAAGNNAFGGSRFAVQRAITEEQIARERASQEAGLRFNAQDRAFGFGAQDADRFTNTSIANAQMANQRTEAQGQMDFNRLLANLNAQNQGAQFNAGQHDTADARGIAAAGQLADISNTAAGNERADLAALAQLGADERNIDGDYRRAPLDLAAYMGQLYGGVPWDVVTGQRYSENSTQTSNPSVASILGSAALAAGGLGWSPFGGGRGSAMTAADVPTSGFNMNNLF